MPLAFPWRLSGAGGLKRDTGSSAESRLLYGEPVVVFVRHYALAGWSPVPLDDDVTPKELGYFDSPQEAMTAADEAWPWWTKEE